MTWIPDAEIANVNGSLALAKTAEYVSSFVLRMLVSTTKENLRKFYATTTKVKTPNPGIKEPLPINVINRFFQFPYQ